MILKCDWHLHSCLSPCGDLTMSPSFIVKTLHQKGINLAAITDHNSTLNCPAFADCCRTYGVAPLFGMEAQTQEEIHVLCLFSALDTALDFGNFIYENMPHFPNNPEKMGDQVYVDKDDDILGEVEAYLVVSAEISINDLEKKVHDMGGLFIPAHAERAAFSLVSQFGFIPPDNYDALEVTRIPPMTTNSVTKAQELLNTQNFPLTTSSDAHFPEHIGRRPFELDIEDMPLYNQDNTVNIETIRKALKNRNK